MMKVYWGLPIRSEKDEHRTFCGGNREMDSTSNKVEMSKGVKEG
jgi:hypothetical protein